jgi:hypothetical protein
VKAGWFFVVKEACFGAITVQLREPRKRFGSRLLISHDVWPGDHESGAAAVEYGKARALARWELNESDRRKYREALEFTK